MNKEFVPYQESLELKELGFDEPCLGNYRLPANRLITEWEIKNTPEHCLGISAPLYQQAFRWFREKYQLYCGILTEYSYGGTIYAYHITGKHQGDISKGEFNTHEEAELACLRKLIELVR